jgi:hypothetical protein
MDSAQLPVTPTKISSNLVFPPKKASELVEDVLTQMSALNVEGMLFYFTGDIAFKFGAKPPGRGKENMAVALNEIFSCLQSINYTFLLVTVFGCSATVETQAVFALKNGKTIYLSGVLVIKTEENQIKLFKMYIDLDPVFAAVGG